MVSNVIFVNRGQRLIDNVLSSLPKRLSAQNESLLKLDDKIGANETKAKIERGLTMYIFVLQAHPSVVPSKDGY